jgi:type II secretory pathway component PulF
MATSFPTFLRLVNSAWTSRTAAGQQQSLLRMIAVAVEENLPLVPLLEAWAADETGTQQLRVQSLVRHLRDGTPLPDAVEAVPGILREEDVLAIRFGAQSGTLPAAIRDVLGESSSQLPASPLPVRNSIAYFCIVLIIGAFIVAFINVKIMPQFHKIYAEFAVTPPSVVEWTWRLSEAIGGYWYLFVLAALLALGAGKTARPGRFLRRTIFARIFPPLRELRAADVLNKLGVATAAGRPIPGALSTLARYHFDPVIRNKLLFVRNEVEQGASVWQSMATAGLVAPTEVRVLETAERVGNRPWALKQLARCKERRTMRRWHRISELVLPLVIVVMGAFVLLQALTVFLFLAKILESLL